jgi:alpha-mannosidase
VGRHFYHHVLHIHPAGVQPAELVRRAENARRPPLCRPVRMTDGPASRSWLAVRPDKVRLSAFYRQDDAVVMRLYNPDAEAADVEVDLPAAPRSALLVDFHLRPLGGDVRLNGRTARFRIRPWQIATLRLTF